MKLSLKICAPKRDEVLQWGDYHVAMALQKYLKRHGHEAIVQIMPEWYNGDDADCDAVIHLRGLERYTTSPRHINVMWNISHPETVSLEEYEDYDIVFVASEIYAGELDSRVSVKVAPLLQCTDPELFYPDVSNNYTADLIFVGNSRNVYRKILRDLLPTQYDLKVWGTEWEKFIDGKYIQGEYFPHENLRHLYSTSRILLNDHWDDMRVHGFISNRIFDALACKAFIISDEVAGLQNVLADAVVTYRDAGDLRGKIEFYLANEVARRQIAEKGYALVTKNHTFDNRVLKIIEYVRNLHERDSIGNDGRGGLAKTLKKKDEEIQYWEGRYLQKEAELNMTIKNFQQSVSWKITSPLRTLHRFLFGEREKH